MTSQIFTRNERPKLRTERARRSKLAALVIRLHQAGFTNDFFLANNAVMVCSQDGSQYSIQDLQIRNIEIGPENNVSKRRIIHLILTPEGQKGLLLTDIPLPVTIYKFSQVEPNLSDNMMCLSPVQSAFLCKKLESALMSAFTNQRINRYVNTIDAESEYINLMAVETEESYHDLRLATGNWDAMQQEDRCYIISSFLRLFKGVANISDYGKACRVFCSLFLNEFASLLSITDLVDA
jgi:hypothetical protein